MWLLGPIFCLQQAAASVGLSLAVSPCARLLQQVGDDLQSLLLGILDSSELQLWDLHSELIQLNTHQLMQHFQQLIETSQQLIGCAGCGSCQAGLEVKEVQVKLQRQGAHLVQRLRKFGQLVQLDMDNLGDFPETFHLETGSSEVGMLEKLGNGSRWKFRAFNRVLSLLSLDSVIFGI